MDDNLEYGIENDITDNKKTNIKNIIIIGIFIIIALLIILFNIVDFSLNGDKEIKVLIGTEYQELGFNAKNIFGKDLTDKVSINNNVDTLVAGTYYVDYNLKYFLKNKKITRKIEVVNDTIDNFNIVLNGKEVFYQDINTKYDEQGGYVLDTITKEKYDNKLKIEGNINTNELGINEIKYIFEYNNEVKEKIRKVIVYEFKEEIDKEISENKYLMNFEIVGIDNFNYVFLPDGKKINDTKFSYEIDNTNKYTFKVYTIDDTEIIHEVSMDNSSNYECSGLINRNGTSIKVTGNISNIKGYTWVIDEKEIEGESEYKNNNSVKSAKIKITLKNGKVLEKNCEIKDELIYHFKYDENNLKEKMSCNTYTVEDKVELDEKLKKAVEEAGYGTRAGVVEAARFLVGNLDYKVPYMGTKAENDAIGRYKKVGLNIGTSGAWGCNVSGYIQGMDCTNFVMWAFYQNGIDTHPYSHGHNDTNSVVNALRVGDLLFTPCDNDCDPKFKYGLMHVGIIIGVDENFFYVAEATTGSINATVVSKWDKNNMPKRGKFSQAKIFNYASDGNITNMWVE